MCELGGELIDSGHARIRIVTDNVPVLIALRQWGERWVSGEPSNPVLVDRKSRRPVATMAVRASDGRPLTLNELEWLDRDELTARDSDPV